MRAIRRFLFDLKRFPPGPFLGGKIIQVPEPRDGRRLRPHDIGNIDLRSLWRGRSGCLLLVVGKSQRSQHDGQQSERDRSRPTSSHRLFGNLRDTVLGSLPELQAQRYPRRRSDSLCGTNQTLVAGLTDNTTSSALLLRPGDRPASMHGADGRSGNFNGIKTWVRSLKYVQTADPKPGVVPRDGRARIPGAESALGK